MEGLNGLGGLCPHILLLFLRELRVQLFPYFLRIVIARREE